MLFRFVNIAFSINIVNLKEYLFVAKAVSSGKSKHKFSVVGGAVPPGSEGS